MEESENGVPLQIVTGSGLDHSGSNSSNNGSSSGNNYASNFIWLFFSIFNWYTIDFRTLNYDNLGNQC